MIIIIIIIIIIITNRLSEDRNYRTPETCCMSTIVYLITL
jgi:hypothetical protein